MIGMFEAAEELGSYSTRHFSLNDIESVASCAQRQGLRGDWWFVRRRDDQSSVYLSETTWQALMRRPVQIMPVDPSYAVVRFGCDADGPWHFADQVLAWALCWDGAMRPITRDGVDGGLPFWDPVYVRMPDGTLEAGPHCDRIDSIEEGLELARKDWEAANARQVTA